MTVSDALANLEVNPDYAFDDADLVLLSSDGIHFRVHSLILKLASNAGGFRDFRRVDGNKTVEVDESEATLSTLLDMVYPSRHAPSTMSYAHFRAVAVAAEKYNMTSVTVALKDIILDKRPLTKLFSEREDSEKSYSAIEQYLMTLDLGWTTIAQELSTKTLTCDLNSEVAQDMLFSADSVAAKNLYSLHRERRIWIYNSLSFLVSGGSERIGNDKQRSACCSFLKEHMRNKCYYLDIRHHKHCVAQTYNWDGLHVWWALKIKILYMLESDASGRQFLSEEFYRSSEVGGILTSPCCKFGLGNNAITLREFFEVVIALIPAVIGTFPTK